MLFVTTPAAAGPDFVGRDHTRPYAASSARTESLPREDLAFRLDSDVLTDAGIQQLDTAARWLAAHRHRIVVEGHADSTGSSAHNADLALRRAKRVRHLLLTYGIAPDRIVVVGYGETNPNDRRVVLYATDAPIEQIATASFDRGALTVQASDRSLPRDLTARR